MVWLAILGVLVLTVLILLAIGNRACRAHWGNWVEDGLSGLNRLFCIHYHGMPDQLVPLPHKKGALLVGNHLSGLDGFLLHAVSPRPVRFMIAKNEAERFGLRWLFRAARVIPVDRSGRSEQAFRAALRALKEGDAVGIFPQGKIGRDGALKRGVIKLAELSQVAVFPVYLDNIEGEGEIAAAVIKRSESITVELGKPVHVSTGNLEVALNELSSFLVRSS